MRHRAFALSLVAILATSALLVAQTEPPPPPPPETEPQATPPPQVTAPAPPAPGAVDRRDDFPNVYLFDGQGSIRLRRLIRNVLFETQINYQFVDGDISTFLRYKYYARHFTYRIGVFDSIEFPEVGSSSTNEFERVRGGLLLIGVPKDYSNRYFFLLQDDRLTFGELANVDNRKNNIYTKIGYQYGTQFDERMNAIVGETRGRITPVLTAFRDIGPQRTGLAMAVTQALRVAHADYKYTKFDAEVLHRTDITARSFVFSRLHAGTFFGYNDVCDNSPAADCKDATSPIERYSIPRYEMFPLGGREALKSIPGEDDAIGIHEVHLTNELFVPIFRNRDYKIGPLHWNTMYGIGYLGAGTAALDYDQLSNTDRFVVDAGIGTESAITIRDFDVYFTVIVATGLHAPDGLKRTKARFSIRTVR